VNVVTACAVSVHLPAAWAFVRLHLAQVCTNPNNHTRANPPTQRGYIPTNKHSRRTIYFKQVKTLSSMKPTLLVQRHRPRTQRHQAASSNPGAVTEAFKLAFACIDDGHPWLFSHLLLQPSCPVSDKNICSGSPPGVPPNTEPILIRLGD
jgi:hypothetical protein